MCPRVLLPCSGGVPSGAAALNDAYASLSQPRAEKACQLASLQASYGVFSCREHRVEIVLLEGHIRRIDIAWLARDPGKLRAVQGGKNWNGREAKNDRLETGHRELLLLQVLNN